MVDHAPKFSILFADAHCIVANKDAGLLTTPAHDEDSLVDALDRMFFGRYSVFPIHRLDRETSGLLVFAKTPETARALAKQFAVHNVEREYCAILAGALVQNEGTLNGHVAGKAAITHFRVIERGKDFTSVAVSLETGRRNQIRIHFADLGHPVIGDTRIGGERAVYDAWKYKRIALHARVLGFWHPAKKMQMRFESELPVEMAELLKK